MTLGNPHTSVWLRQDPWGKLQSGNGDFGELVRATVRKFIKDIAQLRNFSWEYPRPFRLIRLAIVIH